MLCYVYTERCSNVGAAQSVVSLRAYHLTLVPASPINRSCRLKMMNNRYQAMLLMTVSIPEEDFSFILNARNPWNN